jgi:RHS repeat-associated protein
MTYDAVGRKASVTDAANHTTSYAYDGRGHLTDTTYADATTVHDVYDARGRRTSTRDQTGATTTYGYDDEGQLTSVTDALNHVTQYAYDAAGNLITVTDAKPTAGVTRYEYDLLNRKTKRTLPLGMFETFAYDPYGNVTSHVDFKARTTTQTWDNRGRLLARIPDPSLVEPTESYAYYTNGTRSSMTDASGTTTYTYDTRDRLLTKATPAGTLTYTHDAAGNVATIRSSNTNGTSVDYAWDAANQLASVTDNRVGGMTTAAYTPTGRPASLADPNGVNATYSYNTLDRVTSLAWNRGTNPAFASWGYTYNNRGQRLTSTEINNRLATYGYDAATRLTSEAVTGDPRGGSANGTLTYGLDNVGNRLSRTAALGLPAQSFSYNANDQINTDAFDLNGNTTSSAGTTYAYDYQNRLKSKNNGAVTLVYDCDGNRVAKTVGGVTTKYLVDDLNPTGYVQVLEEVSGGAVQVRYTYGTSVVSEARLSGTPTTRFYGYDAHGNVTFLTDAAGAVTDAYEYDAWGNLVGQTGTSVNTRLYAGEQLDPDFGLVNLRARYYSPGRGRFWTIDALDVVPTGAPKLSKAIASVSDPEMRAILTLLVPERALHDRVLTPVALNRYPYTSGDPILNVDPSGLVEFIEYGQQTSTKEPLIETIGFPPKIPIEFPNTLTPGPESEAEFLKALCAGQTTLAGKLHCVFLSIALLGFRII